MPSYSKMKKAELIEALRVADGRNEGLVNELIQEQSNYADLEAAYSKLLDKQQAEPAQSNGQIFDMVKRRWNAHGPLYNCRFKTEVPSLPSLAAMCDELQINGRARSEARKDRHGRIWVDIYPKSEERELFEQTEEVAS